MTHQVAKLAQSREVRILVSGVLGSASMFFQGGSVRLILPKKVVRALLSVENAKQQDANGNFENPSEREFDMDLLFILCNKGIILSPLQGYLRDTDMN